MAEQLDLFDLADDWIKKIQNKQANQHAIDFLAGKDRPKPKTEYRRNVAHPNYQAALKRRFPHNPVCTCGCLLMLRMNSKTNEQFWGCSNYPECKETRKYQP